MASDESYKGSMIKLISKSLVREHMNATLNDIDKESAGMPLKRKLVATGDSAHEILDKFKNCRSTVCSCRFVMKVVWKK